MCHRCLSNSYEGCRWVGSCDDFGVIIIFKHLQNLSCQRLDFSSALSLQFGWLIPHGCSVGTRILRGRSYFRHLIFIQTGTGCNQAVLPAFSRMRTWLEVPWTKRSSSSSTWDNRDTLGERRLTSDQSLHNWLWFFLLWMNLSENWRTAKFVKSPLSTKNRTEQDRSLKKQSLFFDNRLKCSVQAWKAFSKSDRRQNIGVPARSESVGQTGKIIQRIWHSSGTEIVDSSNHPTSESSYPACKQIVRR